MNPVGSSLNTILSIATSGLQTAQTQVNAASNNISNVNTPGYGREVVTQSETVVGGTGAGVQVDSVTRAANAFLQKASLSASSSSGSAAAVSNFLDQAQQLFGDPSSSTSFFSGLDNLYSAFSAAADSPSSSLSRSDAVSSVTTFLNSANSMSANLQSLGQEATQQTATDVTQINNILGQITQTNADIAHIVVSGGDASGLQNTQSTLLDQLSNLMQVQSTPNAIGGVTLRSIDGTYLAGDRGSATLTYSTVGTGNLLTATPPGGQPMQVTPGGGEVGGLMQISGVQIPQITSQLGEFMSQAVGQINAAHNAASAVPAPSSLTGTSTGMDLSTAIAGFSGKTTVAVTNGAGVMQQRVDVDFGAGTMTINGGASISFTSSNFLGQLNTALGGKAAAAYVNGALSLSAASGGIAIGDDAATPSSNGGEGFSQFFGLNNLISSSSYAQTQTALTTSSPNTFAAGGTLSLELTDNSGAAMRQVNLTIPATATTLGDVINSLNTSAGAYGSFALDAKGHLAFTPTAAYPGATASVISDDTANSAGGPNLSRLMGLGVNTQAARASSFSVRSDIAADPSKLALAKLDLTQTVGGSAALGLGDGRGASVIAASGSAAVTFSAASAAKATTQSVSDYASQFGGQLGSMASNADAAAQSAAAVLTQANAQRSSAEGVNLDTELVNLTTYQQSYNACARLVQASKDMYTTLLQMMG